DDSTGTGFVHIAPGHGADDFDLGARVGLEVPYTVDDDGFFYADVPIFGGENPCRVLNEKGKTGNANARVIEELQKAGKLLATGRIEHQYPHSWRSKAPVIFRNTPQWFIAMDKDIEAAGEAASLRGRALAAIDDTRFVPAAGQRRLRAMIENRPDWVISRQRAWGVPLTVFVNKKSGELLKDAAVNERIAAAFEEHGADAWFEDGAKERFLSGLVDSPDDWEQVRDILDVWFDSGSTHAFVLEEEHNKGRWHLKWPADLYLEGSDQHRGWFHSSLLESCGTRGRAPYEAVLTHGFIMAEDGRKMSKSLGNQVFPQDIIKQNGAEILRLWVSSSDYWEDLRIGPEIIKTNTDAYRKLRNTLRFMLGNLSGFEAAEKVAVADMPELERTILHRLHELDRLVRKGYGDFDFKKITAALFNFATLDLSAFYFDIRKDTLYCDPASSLTRRACRTVLDEVFHCLTAWLAPVLCFTMEEVWLSRFPSEDDSVHLRQFPDLPASWRDDALAEKWDRVRALRKVVTGALEIERREKRIGSSLEAAPAVYVTDKDIAAAMEGIDLAEIAITSQATLVEAEPPAGAFTLDEVPGVAVVPGRAQGRKCQRSWKILPDIGADPEFPDLSRRDAAAVREWDRLNAANA
ncbi:MAG TPA: isoleucine--tRNA ligase, partial [Rhodobacteraceae bacterium]|nr:isoleucine--tRNA ligase [Paracoccaceae bacterium]